jgi:hypothetical protein
MAAEKTFTCEHCKTPGIVTTHGGRQKYHKACYAEAQRTGRKKIACRTCGKAIESRGTKTATCQLCERSARSLGAATGQSLDVQLLELLKRGEHTPRTLAEKTRATPGQVLDRLLELQTHGHNVHNFGELWSLEKKPASGGAHVPVLTSDKEGWFKIGAVSDTHLCSKQERLDELKDFYRVMDGNGISTVLHSGNYIDGEAPFNKYELLVRGMDAQLEYAGEHYPQHKGIDTYLISGDDHEGWYCQREGVDIGRYAEDVMRRNGRTDWHNLGYMEAFIPLRHLLTGAQSMYHVIHPGGGSSYATSYTVQKLVEGYEGGEKPAIAQVGHYHKSGYLHTRNVHTIQPGCFQDQTIFARKKKLTFTIGGWILMFRQHPDTGAIEDFVSYFKPYFNRGYYVNNRWSLSGDITKVPRIASL